MRPLTKRNIIRGIPLYIMLILPMAWYAVFCYVPMGGIIVAFKDYNIFTGILKSPFASPTPFAHFLLFLKDDYFWKIFLNTFRIGFFNTLICFPAPIILALVFNEIRPGKFKKATQSISYMPYFVSTVAIVNIAIIMLSQSDGVVNNILQDMGMNRINFLTAPQYFISIYVTVNLWRSVGWGTIIYIASMSNINMELYEAADIEGANRFQKMWHITLPAIRYTIIILFILAVPGIIYADLEMILLLQTPQTLTISDVLATYVYRRGLIDTRYDFAAAIGLFSAVINMTLILITNKITKKVADVGIF